MGAGLLPHRPVVVLRMAGESAPDRRRGEMMGGRMPQNFAVDPYGYVRHLEGRFTVAENARRLQRYRWLEAQMMELQGGWIATMPLEKVKTGLAVATFEDAYHAD